MTATSYRDRRGWTAAELCRTDFPSIRWAVPGLVPEGLSFLVGAPKVGKSWLALALAVAVASGSHALGRTPVEPGAVLYLALEDGPRRLRARLDLLEGGAPDGLHVYSEWTRGTQAVTDVADWLGDHPDARLVVVDTLARVKGPAANGTTFYDADTAAVAGWQRLAVDRSVAVVILHHDRKASAEDFIDAVSGTHGLAGVADTTILLERTRMDSVGRLRITGRDVEEAEHALTRVGVRWELADGPAPDPNLGDLSNQIVAAVVANPGGIGPHGVAANLQADEAKVKVYLGRLVASGRLRKTGRGLYVAPFAPDISVTSVTSDGSQGIQGNGSNGVRVGHPAPNEDALWRARVADDPDPERYVA